jgi:hypothetical protein
MTMGKSYRIEPTVLNDSWDAFIAASPVSTIFSTSYYLSNISCRLGLYRCYNGNEVRALIAVVESPNGESAILDDLVIYGGIIFGAPTYGQNRSQRISERHEISTFIVKALTDRYKEIEFNLAPSIDDVRAFLWYKYGQESGRFHVDVRYTSYLSIADFSGSLHLEGTEVYQEATGARRQQIRYALRDGVTTEEFHDVSLFIDFYRKTMDRQGELVPLGQLDRMAQLITVLLDNGSAKMFTSSTSQNERGSIIVYAFDQYRAYYLFGGSEPALRSTPTGTAVLWDSFSILASNGVKEIDLEGVNSPYRGWFKLSFGGSLISYYGISKKFSY